MSMPDIWITMLVQASDTVSEFLFQWQPKISGTFAPPTSAKHFLQGVTYKELVEATGEPLREVHFVLPAYCVAVLRTLPGYEDFDPRTEVFHGEKPGTGCNDAPRCFSLKLAQVTRTMCGLKPSTVNGELCMKHVVEAGRPKLVAIMTKHVDDLKLAGIVREILLIPSAN